MNALLGLLVKRTLGGHSDEWVTRIREILHRDLGDNYAWPGNVREMEQAVRRIMLSREYRGQIYAKPAPGSLADKIQLGVSQGTLTAKEILSYYCALLYKKHDNIEEVARRMQLDRRTVKKYLQSSGAFPDPD